MYFGVTVLNSLNNSAVTDEKGEFVELWRKMLAVMIVVLGITGMLLVTQFVLGGSVF